MRKIEPVLRTLAITVMTRAAAAVRAATLVAAAHARATDLAIHHIRHADLFRTADFTPPVKPDKLVRPPYGRRSGLHGKARQSRAEPARMLVPTAGVEPAT